jgi:hypothetical protein
MVRRWLWWVWWRFAGQSVDSDDGGVVFSGGSGGCTLSRGLRSLVGWP